MLSLKKNAQCVSEPQPISPVGRLLDLPKELLDYIIELLSGDYQSETLCPLSLTCSRLRSPVQAVLFTSVNIVLGHQTLHRKETLTEWLLCRSRIRSYIKRVGIHASLKLDLGNRSAQCMLLVKLLPRLDNLERLW